MDRDTIKFILSSLPKGRTVFYEFPDRYALLILEHALRDGERAISDLKLTDFAPLLNKPCVKQLLAERGGGSLVADDLMEAWPKDPMGYRLTLGLWPGIECKPDPSYHQITRRGWSLVLQLNFAMSHQRDLGKTVADWENPNEYSCHPVAGGKELTLAWARIDIDLDTGEALIEEIQSDWVRDVNRYTENGEDENRVIWQKYFDDFLKPQTRKWPETMLTATLWFLLSELGLKEIFYHTHETGNEMKGIRYNFPPKSMYTDLPKKFCFHLTHNGPLFLRDTVNKKLNGKFIDPKTKWHVLSFKRKLNH